MSFRDIGLMICVFGAVCGFSQGQNGELRGRVQLGAPHDKSQMSGGGVIGWLTSVDGDRRRLASSTLPKERLTQKDKSFSPHLLVVPVGSGVEFPNRDPWFHNVFSLFDGKKFDLGLYEAGESRTVRFEREGISYIFCNIHPEMSAVVVAVDSPYLATSDKSGNLVFRGVEPGRYLLHIWSEHAPADTLLSVKYPVSVIAGTNTFGTLTYATSQGFPKSHSNKYGRDYDRRSTPDAAYRQ